MLNNFLNLNSQDMVEVMLVIDYKDLFKEMSVKAKLSLCKCNVFINIKMKQKQDRS